MVLLAKYPKKRYLHQFLFIILTAILLKLAPCSDISEYSESPKEGLQNGENLSIRPEGATSLPIKKSVFDMFKLEKTIDKYVTPGGKKVKVKLIRKHRPIFGSIIRWRIKRKNKREAKRKYKEERKKKDGLSSRLVGRKRQNKSEGSSTLNLDVDETNSKSDISNEDVDESENSTSKDDIFEDTDENGTNGRNGDGFTANGPIHSRSSSVSEDTNVKSSILDETESHDDIH